ncbi:transglutaminaseTgpA domain-containing protein [Glutamicibacter sp.]|uniref:transglutaminase family protein n=1 Tax=Glutamicibacter sp. TaxID=1931995 RepID=UPI0028BD5A72|nr:transglutaminaseTgpA domain-containing protein [Glutamicibacter sp.]
MSKKLPLWRYGVDAAVLGIALALGAFGLWDAYGGSINFVLTGLGGVIAGLGLAWANVYFRWDTWRTVGAFVLVYLLLGTPLATPREATFSLLPNLESLRILVSGVVLSWKDMLTVAPPVGSYGGVLIVAFLSTLLASLLAGLAAWRLRSPYFTVIPVLALFVVGIVFGTRDVPLLIARSVVFVAVIVCWLAWRRHLAHQDEQGLDVLERSGEEAKGNRELLLRRVALGTAVLLGAGGLTAVAAPLLSPDAPRQVLRDVLEPPVDLYDFPSPLTDFRRYVKDKSETTLLTVRGLPEGQRIRLAALDSYNGMVFNVDPESSGSYSPVGDSTEIRSGQSDSQRPSGKLEITIDDYQGAWVPGGGKLNSIDLGGARSDELSRSLFYSPGAETMLSSVGLRNGDSYTMNVQFPLSPSDEQLSDAKLGDLRMPKLANVPPVAGTKAVDFIGAAEGDLNRIRSLENALSTGGFLSHGSEGEPQSLSGHGAGRITALLSAKEMIGDDEQFAAAMALMAREQGIPARVVMGFYPQKYNPAQPVAITGGDVHAWVEINYEGLGWVPFNPTPTKNDEPTPPEKEPKAVPQPQVLQPPPPAQKVPDLPPQTAPEPQALQEQPQNIIAQFGKIILIVAITLGSIFVLLLPFMLIALLKHRRRTKRATTGSTSDRIDGGWQELLSAATDHRVVTQVGATRRENAALLAAGFTQLGEQAYVMARTADEANFSAQYPDEAAVKDYWEEVTRQSAAMGEKMSTWQKLRAKYSPRSLVHELLGTINRNPKFMSNIKLTKNTKRAGD